MANCALSQCYSCKGFAVWIEGGLVYPAHRFAVEPHEAMPANIKTDFVEAASIMDTSPRGAAALLRLCIQKLTIYLGEPGDNLNADIGALVKKGLQTEVQQALDIVRVTGNNAVHPGTIDLKDDKDTAATLFELVNMIVERMIAAPEKIKEMFGKFPPGAIEGIKKRDSKKD